MATPPQTIKKSSLSLLKYNENTEAPSDARNVLLIVAALITAVTFQAGVNPPGGVWQKDDEDGHKAGTAVYSDQEGAFYAFLISNTLALSTSILLLISLTYKFPFHLELWISILSMFATYASAIFAISPYESVSFRSLLAIGAVPFVIRFLWETFKWWKGK